MQPRQAIVYDAVGTLIHVTPSVAEIYATVGRSFGSRLDVAEVRRRFPVAFARQEELDRAAGWRTDENRERRRWRAIVGEVLEDALDPHDCFETLWHTFGEPEAWQCDPESASVIAHFHRRGVRQAVASNFDLRLLGILHAIPAFRLLNPVVISSEIGWRKPAPEFFARLAETLQLPPREIHIVGDDRGNDYDAALAAGLSAVLFDPTNKYRDVRNRITRLSALTIFDQSSG